MQPKASPLFTLTSQPLIGCLLTVVSRTVISSGPLSTYPILEIWDGNRDYLQTTFSKVRMTSRGTDGRSESKSVPGKKKSDSLLQCSAQLHNIKMIHRHKQIEWLNVFRGQSAVKEKHGMAKLTILAICLLCIIKLSNSSVIELRAGEANTLSWQLHALQLIDLVQIFVLISVEK